MPEHVKVTILCDNIVYKSNLLAEHGLSFLIETGKNNILFDTGQGLSIKQNIRTLNINLKLVDKVVLSHGHYDHTGGLEKVLNDNPSINIYAHPDIFQPKYKKLITGKMEYIGIPLSLLKDKSRFKLNRQPFQLTDHILLTGEIPRETSFEKIDEDFYVKTKDNRWVKDNLLDDQALVITTQSGLILILGCTHSGLINTLNYVIKITGQEEFKFILGGTHLKGATEEKIQKTITALGNFNIKKIVLSHCTGIPAFNKLQKSLGNKVSIGKVGESWQIAL